MKLAQGLCRLKDKPGYKPCDLLIKSSALLGLNILSSLNAVMSTNEKNQTFTGHMIYNPAYN